MPTDPRHRVFPHFERTEKQRRKARFAERELHEALGTGQNEWHTPPEYIAAVRKKLCPRMRRQHIRRSPSLASLAISRARHTLCGPQKACCLTPSIPDGVQTCAYFLFSQTQVVECGVSESQRLPDRRWEARTEGRSAVCSPPSERHPYGFRYYEGYQANFRES